MARNVNERRVSERAPLIVDSKSYQSCLLSFAPLLFIDFSLPLLRVARKFCRFRTVYLLLVLHP